MQLYIVLASAIVGYNPRYSKVIASVNLYLMFKMLKKKHKASRRY